MGAFRFPAEAVSINVLPTMYPACSLRHAQNNQQYSTSFNVRIQLFPGSEPHKKIQKIARNVPNRNHFVAKFFRRKVVEITEVNQIEAALQSCWLLSSHVCCTQLRLRFRICCCEPSEMSVRVGSCWVLIFVVALVACGALTQAVRLTDQLRAGALAGACCVIATVTVSSFLFSFVLPWPLLCIRSFAFSFSFLLSCICFRFPSFSSSLLLWFLFLSLSGT